MDLKNKPEVEFFDVDKFWRENYRADIRKEPAKLDKRYQQPRKLRLPSTLEKKIGRKYV